MPDIPLRDVIGSLRARLQTDLEAELANLADSHEDALAKARRAAEAEAEQKWTQKLEAVAAEWRTRLDAEVRSAQEEVERRLTADATRARIEAEQAVAETAANLRRELEDALAAERERSAAEHARFEAERQQLEAERLRAEAERARIAEERDRAEAERQQADAGRQQAETEKQQAEAQRQQAEAERQRAEAEREQADAGRQHADAERQRAEAEKQKADGERERADAERQRAEADRQRAEEERQRAEEARRQAAAEVERALAERQRVERELAQARAMLDVERAQAAQAIETAGRAVPTFNAPRLVAALADIDAATNLTGVIRAVVAAARAEAPRAALFVVNGDRLDEWRAPGAPALTAGPVAIDAADAGVLAGAMSGKESVVSGPSPAPGFAALRDGRRAVAVPFVFADEPVAVLYADEGTAEGRDGWIDAVQILGRHASATAACITARKTAEAVRLAQGLGGVPSASVAATSEDAEQGARRYARLLVSEIRLYNEAAVRTGRQKRDLLQRLKPEIDRARRLYEERVPASVPGRDACFQQELVQTLADGDLSLLA